MSPNIEPISGQVQEAAPFAPFSSEFDIIKNDNMSNTLPGVI